MDSLSVHPPKSQVLFSQIPSAVQPVDHIPYIILKSVHYLTRWCTSACHADKQKQFGGKCRAQQKHPYFFHCALSFDGVYALLSVYYNDPVGQFACPFCKRYFLLFLYVATQKPPRLPVTETGAVRLFYLCFFKRSRNYLRGFLMAAWAGAKITERSFYSTMTLIIIEWPFSKEAPRNSLSLSLQRTPLPMKPSSLQV